MNALITSVFDTTLYKHTLPSTTLMPCFHWPDSGIPSSSFALGMLPRDGDKAQHMVAISFLSYPSIPYLDFYHNIYNLTMGKSCDAQQNVSKNDGI